MRGPGRLLDVAAVARELGVSRAAAERIFRQMPRKVRNKTIRKTWIYRDDLEAWLKANTVKDTVA